MTAEVQHFGGSVARLIGDGVLVCFGYPAAHEDDAERAVRAGLAVIAAIHKLKVHPDIVLNARIGIATGLVVVSTIGEGPGQEWTVLGDTPNLAARLQTIAAPGTVVYCADDASLGGGTLRVRHAWLPRDQGYRQPA